MLDIDLINAINIKFSFSGLVVNEGAIFETTFK